jgi:outer membrane protein insertion porin family
MQPGRPFKRNHVRNGILAAFFFLTTLSCNRVFVKNYPHQPFVYQTNIKLIGNIPNDSAELLQSRLKNQLDDSMKVRTVRKLIADKKLKNWLPLNRPVLDHPAVYDSTSADRSVIYMHALMNSLGYFKDSITFSSDIDTVKKDQYRTTVTFNVKPGHPIPLDSISYNIHQQELQQLALQTRNVSYLKKGQPFAKTTISLELDRLTELYRNSGYMRFGRDLLQGLWDTIDVSLLRPVFDPTEQFEILQKLKEQREHPRADLEIRLKPGVDTARLTKYYVGNVVVIPDFNYSPRPDSIPDTTKMQVTEKVVDGVIVRYYYYLFKPKLFPPNIFLIKDSLYDERNHSRTIDRLNSLGAWRSASIEPRIRPGKDTADFIIRLTPALKYSFTTNLEASLNTSSISGNLVGFSLNGSLQIRNLFKTANLSTTSLRYGVETGKNSATNVKFIQTRQLSFSQSLYFPRALVIENTLPKSLRENASTVFNFNAATTERRNLFNLVTFNGSFGYEFHWLSKKEHSHTIITRLLNLESSNLDPKPLLDTLFTQNPSLKYVFTDGFVSSVIFGYTRSSSKKLHSNIFRTNLETSGNIAGQFKGRYLDSNLYRFLKVDVEWIRKYVYQNTALVLRLFAGVGNEFNSTVNPNKRNNLPFFKQYFAGGPNSMRAWALRKLGPGSVIKDFSIDPERYGDVQLEGNIEYRFPMGKPLGIKVQGALFTDIGNVWFLKKAGVHQEEEVFNFSRLGKDIAIGTGIGFRIDFSLFVVRLDFSHKVKDPSPSPDKAYLQNKWFGYINKDFFRGTQFQLGISYPFIL